ncbi:MULTISPECIES: HupE/UreJ family protein [Giesbergeria]|uniref:HupE/UreJ family protein n=1 Tax=Giesbergeria sinuosa TaxID=80883 RepID=A0ABV9QAQ2_9BURK
MTQTQPTSPMRALRTVAPALLALGSSAALAHAGVDAGEHHGFLSGLLHPMSGLDHLGAMLAVGLWSATTTARPGVAPLSFALTLLAGALLAQSGLSWAGVEPMIVASLLVVGLLLAAQTRLPLAVGGALVGAFALFHGMAHGQELNGGPALLGMVVGTALLHGVGLAAGLVLRQRHRWVSRAAGVAVAASGVVLGWPLLMA